jgi:hypothetical protein
VYTASRCSDSAARCSESLKRSLSAITCTSGAGKKGGGNVDLEEVLRISARNILAISSINKGSMVYNSIWGYGTRVRWGKIRGLSDSKYQLLATREELDMNKREFRGARQIEIEQQEIRVAERKNR